MSLISALFAAVEAGVEGYHCARERLSKLAADTDLDQSDGSEPAEAPEPFDGVHVEEVVERALDRFLDRLGALDLVLIGVVGGTLAIGGLAADNRLKYPLAAIGLLAVAYVAGVVGLLMGNAMRRPADAPHPFRAMIGLVSGGEEALADLTYEIAKNWARSQWLGRFKIWAVAIALAFLTAGTAVLMWEKLVVPGK